MSPPLDYELNKLFHQLHTVPELAEAYRKDRAAVIAQYKLSPEVVTALERDDVAALVPRTNGFLMRYYFNVVGLPEQSLLAQLRAMRTKNGSGRDG